MNLSSKKQNTPDDYAAFVAIDWADEKHAFSLQVAGQAKKETGIQKLIERLHELNGAGEFSVDTLYVRWLRDLMNDPAKVDLARRVSVNQAGQVNESSVPPSPDMIEAFADLLEKLGDALAA